MSFLPHELEIAIQDEERILGRLKRGIQYGDLWNAIPD